MPGLIEHVAIGVPDRVPEQLIANEAPVDERELQVRLGARECRRGDPAFERHAFEAALEPGRMLEKLRTAKCRDAGFALGTPGRGLEAELTALIVLERERNVGAREREIPDDGIEMAELRALGTQEFSARRYLHISNSKLWAFDIYICTIYNVIMPKSFLSRFPWSEFYQDFLFLVLSSCHAE